MRKENDFVYSMVVRMTYMFLIGLLAYIMLPIASTFIGVVPAADPFSQQLIIVLFMFSLFMIIKIMVF